MPRRTLIVSPSTTSTTETTAGWRSLRPRPAATGPVPAGDATQGRCRRPRGHRTPTLLLSPPCASTAPTIEETRAPSRRGTTPRTSSTLACSAEPAGRGQAPPTPPTGGLRARRSVSGEGSRTPVWPRGGGRSVSARGQGNKRGKKKRTSRPVSRILSRAVIHLGSPLPTTSSGLPAGSGGPPSSACADPGRDAPGPLGLAPGGVYRAAWVTPDAGGLLHHPFTLARTPDASRAGSRWRSALCGTFPRVTPGGRYPPPCPVESGLSSAGRGVASSPDATARPTRPSHQRSEPAGVSGRPIGSARTGRG
ncbi:hypothetical protein DFJ64_3446 [Thermasporomyces composti]|uniref:Uncharacterized protein n=1 Tax=Thermasporomyces composti TaxID=696763 RepID=A0A3D9VBB0_THECX|nr:hypothetical protein DFJ64_3446 [Thermasporomyces composti]